MRAPRAVENPSLSPRPLRCNLGHARDFSCRESLRSENLVCVLWEFVYGIYSVPSTDDTVRTPHPAGGAPGARR